MAVGCCNSKMTKNWPHLDELVTPLEVGINELKIDRVVGEQRQVFDAQRAALDAGALGRVVSRLIPARVAQKR
jgi:hypothetical protein